MSLEIVLTRGGVARLVESDGDRTVVASPVAAPPGSTLAGAVVGCPGLFELKVKSCRREGEGFRVEGRLRNATRQLREILLR